MAFVKISDEIKERCLVLICACILFLFHGLRDFVVTAFPQIVVEKEKCSNNTIGPVSCETTSYLPEDNGWNAVTVGFSLSSNHLGILLSYVLLTYFFERASLKWQMIVSLLLTGIISLLTHAASNSPAGFIIVRLIQGIFQAWSYPAVYAVIQNMKQEHFCFTYTFIFSMPWLGTAIGMLIGISTYPFVVTYVFGSICIILTPVIFILDIEEKKTPVEAWKETLKSKRIWSTGAFHAGSIFALHTFLIGITLTTNTNVKDNGWVWVILFMIILSGAVNRIIGLLRVWLIHSSILSVLKRRKMLALVGVIVSSTCLCLCGTIGVENSAGLFPSGIVGTAIGTSIGIIAARMCFHDLAPCLPLPSLHVGNMFSSLGAFFAYLMFPSISLNETLDKDDAYWTVAWTIPVVVLFILMIQFFFFVKNLNTLPYQIPSISVMVEQNGSFRTPAYTTDDTKSFKSARSAFTYRTAVSTKDRVRTGSFLSLPYGSEVHTIENTESEACQSLKDYKEPEMASIKSGMTFKTVNSVEGNPTLTEISLANGHNRTFQWLQQNQKNGINGKFTKPQTEDRERAQRNMLLALQW